MKTPVSFEIAKLLKKKGFDIPCWSYYSSLNLYTFELTDWNNHTIGDTSMHKRNAGYYSAPTIVEVVMWLYEKHGIWIEITMGKDHTGVWFDWDIFSTITPRKDDELGEESVEYEDNPNEKWLNYKTTYNSMIEDERFAIINKESYSSPTEAYEAAIEYTLKNLL